MHECVFVSSTAYIIVLECLNGCGALVSALTMIAFLPFTQCMFAFVQVYITAVNFTLAVKLVAAPLRIQLALTQMTMLLCKMSCIVNVFFGTDT